MRIGVNTPRIPRARSCDRGGAKTGFRPFDYLKRSSARPQVKPSPAGPAVPPAVGADVTALQSRLNGM